MPFRYRGSRRSSAVAQLSTLGIAATVFFHCRNYAGNESTGAGYCSKDCNVPIAGAGRNYRIERGQDCIVLVLFHIRMSLIAMPNNSPEPTPMPWTLCATASEMLPMPGRVLMEDVFHGLPFSQIADVLAARLEDGFALGQTSIRVTVQSWKMWSSRVRWPAAFNNFATVPLRRYCKNNSYIFRRMGTSSG